MMHEFSLYGTVAANALVRVKQQLAGISRMQPQQIHEIHLIFKAKPPSGIANLPSAGGSQGVIQQDVQRIKNMLNSSLYYIQLIGQLTPSDLKSPKEVETPDADDVMHDINHHKEKSSGVNWSLEFKDTPDPGKQLVSSRLVSKISLGDGNPALFLEQFGYEYVSRYFIQGYKFYDQSTTLFLHQILHLPQVLVATEAIDISSSPAIGQLQPVDPGHQYILQASIDVVDGNHPSLKDRATKDLLAMKQTLRQVVDLTPGDRLALDSKIPISRRL